MQRKQAEVEGYDRFLKAQAAAEVHRAAWSPQGKRGDTPGSFGQSGEAQWRNQCIEIFLVAIRQSLRPTTGGQVRVVGKYLPYRDARLVLTAEAPERSHKNRLRGQSAWLLD